MAAPTFSFSSATIRPGLRFDAYHDLYAIGCDVSRTSERFLATVKAYRFDRMLVFERRLSGVEHGRDAARVRRDGFDHLTLHLVLAGRLIAGPPGAERPVTAGEIVVFDCSVPYRNRAYDARILSVSLARDQIGATIPDIRPFHGTVLAPRESSVIADLILSFTRRYETLPVAMSDQFGHVLGILVSAALQGAVAFGDRSPGSAAFDRLDADLGRRARAEAHIEAHLGDQDLDADGIATGIGVSRSVLYRCFAEDGGVARFIQQRRLDRIRKVLRRSTESDKLASIARSHGFASEQHLNRAFRATFGQPPGQFRNTDGHLRRGKPQSDEGARTLSEWLVELY